MFKDKLKAVLKTPSKRQSGKSRIVSKEVPFDTKAIMGALDLLPKKWKA
jgi:hypothetical protein